MFDITFENEKGERSMVWQNSWAYTTRSVILIFLLLEMDFVVVLDLAVSCSHLKFLTHIVVVTA